MPRDFVVTARVGSNAHQFPDILRLYVPEGSTVADVTWGKGVFWQSVETDKYNLLATDLRPEHGGVDMRAVPYADDSLDAFIIDPPYMHTPGSIKESVARAYYNNNDAAMSVDDLIGKYVDAFKEAWRCLHNGGVIIVKCQDTVESGKQRLVHVHLIDHLWKIGFVAEDLFIMVQDKKPTYDPKWTVQKHARKNHSYFLVFRKPKTRKRKPKGGS